MTLLEQHEETPIPRTPMGNPTPQVVDGYVLGLLERAADNGEGLKVCNIAETAGLRVRFIHPSLARLRKRGKVVSIGKGWWRLYGRAHGFDVPQPQRGNRRSRKREAEQQKEIQ